MRYSRQAEQPRVAVPVDLHSISRDLQEIKTAIALWPTRSQILRLELGCLDAMLIAL
jgi:hypothetical protein